MQRSFDRTPPTVGDDVLVGISSTILPGASVGDERIVAAGDVDLAQRYRRDGRSPTDEAGTGGEST